MNSYFKTLKACCTVTKGFFIFLNPYFHSIFHSEGDIFKQILRCWLDKKVLICPTDSTRLGNRLHCWGAHTSPTRMELWALWAGRHWLSLWCSWSGCSPRWRGWTSSVTFQTSSATSGEVITHMDAVPDHRSLGQPPLPARVWEASPSCSGERSLPWHHSTWPDIPHSCQWRSNRHRTSGSLLSSTDSYTVSADLMGFSLPPPHCDAITLNSKIRITARRSWS